MHHYFLNIQKLQYLGISFEYVNCDIPAWPHLSVQPCLCLLPTEGIDRDQQLPPHVTVTVTEGIDRNQQLPLDLDVKYTGVRFLFLET